MIDGGLLRQVLRLDAASRREFVRAVELSLDHDDVPQYVLAEVDVRLAAKGVAPDSRAVTAESFISNIREHRGA